MHEMSYILRIVRLAEKTAEENQLTHVDSVEISVGEMTGLVPEYLSRYYPEAARGTALEDSSLVIHPVAVRARCENCGIEFAPTRGNHYCCPACGSARAKVLAGREFELMRITGE